MRSAARTDAEAVVRLVDEQQYSPSDAEFLDSGAGWLRGCVLLPHARRRLRTDDPARMAELAARAAPTRCVVLDDGVRLDGGAARRAPAGGARRRRSGTRSWSYRRGRGSTTSSTSGTATVECTNDPLNPKISYSPRSHLVGVLRARVPHTRVDLPRPRRPTG